MSNPLLEPIHGVSLYDYAVVSAKTVSGADVDDLLKALGIENAIFEEASALWIARMQEDSTFEVVTLYGQYFAEADNHPKLKDFVIELSDAGVANLEKMKSDRYFYEELNAARQAAYAYGYDGAQWIQDNFGIPLGEFQSVSMQWSEVQNEEMSDNDYETIRHFIDYQQQKQEEYAKKFAEEQGGNIADDIEF